MKVVAYILILIVSINAFGVQQISAKCTYWFKDNTGVQTAKVELANISHQGCYENALNDYRLNINKNFLELIIDYHCCPV